VRGEEEKKNDTTFLFIDIKSKNRRAKFFVIGKKKKTI